MQFRELHLELARSDHALLRLPNVLDQGREHGGELSVETLLSLRVDVVAVLSR